ncbi:rhomboid-like protein [Actinomadura kijaniata]|uniref:rhomboid-like protein n=1 Tax=Actinomadura kijaniata TaxID=46161 RepID=UPI00157C5131|nr:rhomboid-like protein [Actinomadura kijaniata]
MIAVGVLLALVWYGLRGLGRWWGLAARWVGWVSPWTRWAHAWVLSAPATFGYVVVFSALTSVQLAAPPRLVDLLTTLQSTNLRNLHRAPLRALLHSALWVADKGAGLPLYVLVFVSVVAWAERRYGTPRIVVVGLAGHVLGTLLTALVEVRALEAGRASARLAVTTDVGVSYIMVAGCAAAVLVMRGWWRVVGWVLLGVGVVGPVVWSRTLWDLGHLFATVCGLGVAWVLVRAAPLRRPPDLRGCLPVPACGGRDRGPGAVGSPGEVGPPVRGGG